MTARARPSIDVLATEAQVRYLESLRDGKQLECGALTPEQVAWVREADFASISKKRASDVIGTLKHLPWTPKSVPGDISAQLRDVEKAVADGRYAVLNGEGKLAFYSVKQGKHVKFVDVWASDSRWPIKNVTTRLEVLQKIAGDPDAGPRFGREIGRCYVCGRTLTDDTSRALGIGPICRDM